MQDNTLAEAAFNEAFSSEVAKREERAPKEYPLAAWTVGGRKSKANPDGETPAWWLDNGAKQVQTWLNWREAQGWPVWVAPNGDPGIELDIIAKHPFKEFGPPVRSIIDRVFTVSVVSADDRRDLGDTEIVDLKSGSYTPNSPMQLGINAVCMEVVFGPEHRPRWGSFWMGRKGGLVGPFDLSVYTVEMVFAWAERAAHIRDNRLFIPHASQLCGSCSVRDFCPIQYGPRADEFKETFE